MGYFYIFGTVAFTVYGQLILKWRVETGYELPAAFGAKILSLLKLVFDPYIFSGFVAAFVASIFWIAAMTKFDLSYAYPFTSLSFLLVTMLAALFFSEPITLHKIAGLFLILAGIAVTARSS